MSAEKQSTSIKAAPLKAAASMSMTQAAFGLAKSAIGAGALTIPVKLAAVGLVPGVAALLFSSAATTTTLHFLARLAANTDCASYFGLGRLAFGQAGEKAAITSLALFLFGALIFYISFGATSLLEGLRILTGRGTLLAGRDWVLIAFVAMCIYPVASMRDMRSLGKTSIIGMACMVYVLGLTLTSFAATGVSSNIVLFAPPSLATMVGVFSAFLFAFVNHFTMVSTVPVLEDATSARRLRLTAISSSAVVGFYLAIGLGGYLNHGSAALSGVKTLLQVNMGPGFGVALGIAQLAVALMLILSFPLLCDPLRGCVESLLFTQRRVGDKDSAPEPVSMMSTRNLAVTGALVAVPAVIAATFVDQVMVILELFTALSGSLLVFIFPALYFLRLSGPARYRVSKTERVLAYGAIASGSVLLVLGTFYGIMSFLGKK